MAKLTDPPLEAQKLRMMMMMITMMMFEARFALLWTPCDGT